MHPPFCFGANGLAAIKHFVALCESAIGHKFKCGFFALFSHWSHNRKSAMHRDGMATSPPSRTLDARLRVPGAEGGDWEEDASDWRAQQAAESKQSQAEQERLRQEYERRLAVRARARVLGEAQLCLRAALLIRMCVCAAMGRRWLLRRATTTTPARMRAMMLAAGRMRRARIGASSSGTRQACRSCRRCRSGAASWPGSCARRARRWIGAPLPACRAHTRAATPASPRPHASLTTMLEALEPVPGLDPSALLDVLHENGDVVDHVRDAWRALARPQGPPRGNARRCRTIVT